MICRAVLSFAVLAFVLSAGAQAACLPTLGTGDCWRAWDPWVQAIEHRYLDVRLHGNYPRHRPSRHAGHRARPEASVGGD
jgi:hypothetical protein